MGRLLPFWRLHLHSTKAASKNLFKRTLLARIGQMAVNGAVSTPPFLPTGGCLPSGWGECSVATKNHRGRWIDQRLVSMIAALSVLCDNHGIRSTERLG